MTDKHHLLDEVVELLEKYNETIEEFLKDSNHEETEKLEHLIHLIHELKAELVHIEEIKKHADEQKSENTAEFLRHHLEATHHATEHWFHLHHHMELYFEELEELSELHERIMHLRNELQREIQEANENAEHMRHVHIESHKTEERH